MAEYNTLKTRVILKHDTTENWNKVATTFVGYKGEVVIYDDYKQITDKDGNVVNIPGIKVCDGETYVGALPFITDDVEMTLLSHINDSDIHVTSEEKENWNNHLDCSYSDGVLNFIKLNEVN